MNTKQCIIIGGGYSIKKEGLPLDLWNKIKNKFTIGCNINFKHFQATLNTFVDDQFFKDNKSTLYKLPLVIGRYYANLTKNTDTLFTFKASGKHYYGKNSLKKKNIYRSILVGLFSLTLAIALDSTEIYCLGFDWSTRNDAKDSKGRVLTHYYQKPNKKSHRGIGRTYYYDHNNPINLFKPYFDEDVKIYIVGTSNIHCFENISYQTFFNKIKNSPDINQDELRNLIKDKIKNP